MPNYHELEASSSRGTRGLALAVKAVVIFLNLAVTFFQEKVTKEMKKL